MRGVELVANPKGAVLWLKTREAVEIADLADEEFEKEVKRHVKPVVAALYSSSQ